MTYSPERERLRTEERRKARELAQFEQTIIDLHVNTKKRATVKKLDFSLTREDVRDMLLFADGKCQVSGVKLDYGRGRGYTGRRPWYPSIDRISCCYGYNPGNVRIVCVAVNLAMNVWGEKVLRRIAWAIVRKHAGSDPRGNKAERWRRGRGFSHLSPAEDSEAVPAE